MNARGKRRQRDVSQPAGIYSISTFPALFCYLNISSSLCFQVPLHRDVLAVVSKSWHNGELLHAIEDICQVVHSEKID